MELLHIVRDTLVPALDGAGALADRLLPEATPRSSDAPRGRRARASASAKLQAFLALMPVIDTLSDFAFFSVLLSVGHYDWSGLEAGHHAHDRRTVQAGP